MARQEFGEQVVWGGAAHLCPWAAPQAHPRPRAGLPGRQASPSSRPRQRPRPASPPSSCPGHGPAPTSLAGRSGPALGDLAGHPCGHVAPLTAPRAGVKPAIWRPSEPWGGAAAASSRGGPRAPPELVLRGGLGRLGEAPWTLYPSWLRLGGSWLTGTCWPPGALTCLRHLARQPPSEDRWEGCSGARWAELGRRVSRGRPQTGRRGCGGCVGRGRHRLHRGMKSPAERESGGHTASGVC